MNIKKAIIRGLRKFQLKQKFVVMDQCYLIKATENVGAGRTGAARDLC